jgi:membrane peptidoglycan carboxypeptidase
VVGGVGTVVYVDQVELPTEVPLAQTTTVYYADGSTVMAQLGDELRTVIDTTKLPPHVPAAILAAEDPGYFSGNPLRPPSAIARQYARMGADLHGPVSARLLTVALKLEHRYGKKGLLDRYLNRVYFGRKAYGIEAARSSRRPVGVLAYYGGHNGAGVDYAGAAADADAGAGAPAVVAHPPGASFHPYVLASALKAGISVRSWWDSSHSKAFPDSGRKVPVVDTSSCPTSGSVCTLADATTAGLRVPYFGVTNTVGFLEVLNLTRAAGIGSLWADNKPVDLSGAELAGLRTEVGLGQYPITVLDRANGMATIGAGGQRAPAHFVATVSQGDRQLHREDVITTPLGLTDAQIADLTWVLAQNPAGQLLDGRPSAVTTGSWESVLPGSGDGGRQVGITDAWAAGFTPQLAVAVWIGNKGPTRPLVDRVGVPVRGSTLPAQIYRGFLTDALQGRPVTPFPQPAFGGDAGRGNGKPPAA